VRAEVTATASASIVNVVEDLDVLSTRLLLVA